MSADTIPLLWHLEVSHYSEKVRWALDHKAVRHSRRAVLPGFHIPLALWLTRGASITLPIMRIDGGTIHDSTAVIAALEERYPEPPLYPEDAEERRRALELEDHFDEGLGPAARLFAFHQLRNDPERMEALMARTAPPPLSQAPAAAAAYARTLTKIRFKADDAEAAGRAEATIRAALDTIERELGDGDYLVGEEFTVADLTAAALLNPIVLPEEGPLPHDEPPPESLQRFREGVEGRRGFQWVLEIFRRHRHSAAVAAA